MRILMVEDSRVFVRLVERLLTAKMEATLDVVGTMADANTMIGSHDYDLALLDLVLPDAQEGEVVDMVVRRGIPAIAFTGRYDESYREKILKKNVVDYVIKNSPQSAQQIVDIVQRLQRNALMRVLVVDDSATMRSTICSYLRAYRFQTVDAGDGQTALELLKEHQDIQLVISDYNMPGMDGFTLLEKIRQTHSRAQLPFIGVSGANAPYLSARFIKLGANDFLAKPFSKEELYCRVLNSIEMLEYIAELHKLDETKNRFLGMAAHDLRNPINSISGFSGLLLETLEDKIDPQSLQFLKHINQSSDEMLSIVNDLLDINTIQAGRLEIKRERHNIAAILQDRVSLFDTMASRKQIELVFSSEFDDDVLVDRVRICQVLDNLISNAIKFTPSGGTVNVMLADNKQEVRIGVRDSGPGISSDDQKRLFVPYSRAAARPTGGEQSTGLGLAITKRIVEAHGGQVGIDSSLGKGAEFWVLLPKN